MISIRSAVEDLIRRDYTVREGMRRGVINLSQFAREIKEEISKSTKKDVGIQSIVVSLSRLEKSLHSDRKSDEIEIQQLSVQSPIVQLIYPKNQETVSCLTAAIQNTNKLDDIFFSISTSTKDIGLLLSEKILESVKSSFTTPALIEKHALSAVGVRFNEKLVKEANVGLKLLERVAARDIVLDAALTTYNEFTLIFESKYLEATIAALSPKN